MNILALVIGLILAVVGSLLIHPIIIGTMPASDFRTLISFCVSFLWGAGAMSVALYHLWN